MFFGHTWLTSLKVTFLFSLSLSFSLSSSNLKVANKKTVIGAEARIDERPHYFALSLQKRAIYFFRTFMQETRQSCDETVKTFRQHYNEKPVEFQGKLARRVFSKVYWVKRTSYLERTIIWFYFSFKASTNLNKRVFWFSALILSENSLTQTYQRVSINVYYSNCYQMKQGLTPRTAQEQCLFIIF